MSKPNLILLHGALGCKKQLLPLQQLLTNDFEVFLMDFAGHGNRASDQPFSISGFSENVEQFIDEKNIGSAHIFGYSMGGYVALRLAHSNPDKVDKIITLGTKFLWTPASATEEIKKLNPDIIEEKVPVFAQYLDSLHTSNPWKEVVQKTASMMIEMGAGRRLHDSELSEIKHPILLCLADQDNMVTQAETVHVSQLLQNSTIKIIPNSKHPIEKVDVPELSIHVSNFLQDS